MCCCMARMDMDKHLKKIRLTFSSVNAIYTSKYHQNSHLSYCSLMKFVCYLHDSTGAFCVWVRALSTQGLSNDFSAE